MRQAWCAIAIVVLATAAFSPATASPPANFTNELVSTAATQPIALGFLPDGRMLILEKGGRMLICNPNASPVTTATYMTITNINTISERGLLNIVLDPDFGVSNDYFYLYYSCATPARGRISRFTHVENSGGLTSRGNLASEFVVWQDTDGYPACCHYGGGLDFGPDGNLWLTIGEKFTASNAQDLSIAAGKIIRVAPDGTFPIDNFGMSDGPGGSIYDGIFAYGLRNPFRARWDLPTGRFFIGEVGGNDQTISTEDVHVATLAKVGTNFGWPDCEGPCDNPDFPTCNCTDYDDPIFYYPHNGSGASITGGMVYRGSQFPNSPYYGAYFYGDYVRGFIRYLTFNGAGTAVTSDNAFEPSAGIVIFIGEGPNGELYYTTYDNQVRRIVYNGGNQPPAITSASATPDLGTPPLQVTFDATATDPDGDPLTFKWTYGDGDSAMGNVVAGAVPTQMHTYTSNGAYTATLYVYDAAHIASTSKLVRVGHPPTVTITAPVDGSAFVAGDTIYYAGVASDLDETLDGSNYAWTLRFKHNEHFHPGPFLDQPGTGGYWVIESTGHDWYDNTAYVLDVLVTDSDGLTGADTVTVYPQKVNLSFDTSPSGIPVTIDGVPHTTPFIYDTMIGFEHTVSVPATRCLAGTLQTFSAWSDGGAATHVLTVPATDSSYVATYTAGGECVVPVESGLVMHISADLDVMTSGPTVTSWLDQSVSGNDLDFVLGEPQLVPGAINGHAAVAFDGVNDGLGRTGFTALPSSAGDRTMFMVVRYQSDGWGGFAYGTALCNEAFGLSVANTANAGHLMVQGWCTANDFISGTPGNGAGWMTQAVVLQSNSFSHYKDGAVIGSGTHAFATGTQRIRMGVELDDSPFIDMQVAEVLVYDRALTPAEFDQVQAYLDAQYFPPPPPTITITAPSEGALVPGDSLAVSWTSGGDLSYAGHVHVRLDALPEETSAQLTGSWVFPGVLAGPHLVTVELSSLNDVTLAVDSVHVTSSGMPPIVQDDAAVVTQGDSVTVDVLANDGDSDGAIDSSSVAVVTPPARGTIVSVDSVTGMVRYAHDGSYVEADSFTYTVKDDAGNTSPVATVRIAVTLTGAPPAVANVVATATSPAVTENDSLVLAYDLVAPATSGAAAWYRNGSPFAALCMPFEGSAGVALDDFSGNGHAATNEGSPVWLPSGGVGGSGAFAFAAGDALVVPDDPVFDVDTVTLSAWVRLDSYVDDQRVISKEFGTSQPYSIYTLAIGTTGTFTSGEDRIDFRIGLQGQNRIRVIGTQSIPLSTWTHVAATFDGSAVKLYVNGQLDVSQAASGVLRKNAEAVYVGASQFYGQHFSGRIDDACVFGRALSGEQIAALHALGGGVIVPQETALGQTWRACVTPFGAGIAGTPVCSNTLAIGNAPPLALDDTASVAIGDTVMVDVLANDTDADGTVDSSTVVVATPPASGSVAVDPVTGVIRYVHTGSVAGVDSLAYTVDDNSGATSNTAKVRITIDVASAAGGGGGVPARFALYQNVPNPFNPLTTIAYDVPEGGARVTLDVYDVAGRRVARLVDRREGAGQHRITWDGRGTNGSRVASGVYFYRLQAPGFRQTRKMVLLQ